MEDFVPPLPILVEIPAAARHYEATPHEVLQAEVVYIYDGSCLREGDDEIIAQVDAGTIMTAYASSGEWIYGEWLRVTCDKCVTTRRDQWVRAEDFFPSSENEHLAAVRWRCNRHDSRRKQPQATQQCGRYTVTPGGSLHVRHCAQWAEV